MMAVSGLGVGFKSIETRVDRSAKKGRQTENKTNLNIVSSEKIGTKKNRTLINKIRQLFEQPIYNLLVMSPRRGDGCKVLHNEEVTNWVKISTLIA